MSKIQETLKIAATAIDGLEALQHLTKIGGSSAEAALAAVDKLVGVLIGGLDGSVSRADVEAEIAKVRKGLAWNDAAADTAIDKKFGK